MKNLHLLHTDKPSRLHLIENALTITSEYKNSVCDSEVNIYITNDEKIIKSDWAFNPKTNKVVKTGHYGHYGNSSKKIILTTDQDLIKDGVQPIDDDFLEWFVKNPSCEEVKVKLENYYASGALQPNLWQHKIIIPKEEPNPFELPITLPDDVFYESLEEPKQETLEESFSRYENEKYHSPTQGSIPDLESAKFGAKWQAERMYSEEDMIAFAMFYYTHQGKATKYWGKDLFKEWFKQFKKK